MRSCLRRVLARRERLAQTDSEDGDCLRDSMVRNRHGLCFFLQLPTIVSAFVLRRPLESRILFDGANYCTAFGSESSARAAYRPVFYVDIRAARFQWSDGRLRGR